MKRRIVIIISIVLMVALSMVCFAACTPDEQIDGFTVQFKANYTGAEDIAPQKVAKDTNATAPAVERENFVVRAWYKEAELKTEFDLAKEKITEDITLYAGWNSTLYHVAGGFNGNIAKDEDFRMQERVGEDGWFTITLDLTEEVRDQMYDGHYYKVTNGTWNADGTWGADNYALQPAPKSPTGGGMGSVFIYENQVLTINFDSNEKVIYDNSMIRDFSAPRIYGDFNKATERGSDWSVADGEALVLQEISEGVFSALLKIPANADGYSMAVAISEKYYIDEWGNRWGTEEQYNFEGEAVGTGGVSTLVVEEEAIYSFTYDSTTHITTFEIVVAGNVRNLAYPAVYGDFNAWTYYEGENAVLLKEVDETGVFEGQVTLEAYTGEGEGYTATVAISEEVFDDEWGVRWGMKEQYKFDGTESAMGETSFLKPTETTIYKFSYDSSTNVTTVTEVVDE